MSACISRHGEFSSHELDGDLCCTLCGVLDEGALIAERDQFRAALRAVLALHERVPSFHVDPRTFERVPAEDICGECSDDRDAIWPCSTVLAITAALDAS